MPARLAPLAVAVLAAALLGGCGDSSSNQGATQTEKAQTDTAPAGAAARSCEAHSADAAALRATEIPCDQARQAMHDWQREPSCPLPAGASRGSCLTRSYRCLATRTARGVAVSCSRAGQSVAFTARRG